MPKNSFAKHNDKGGKKCKNNIIGSFELELMCAK
jgi:hypothetical protein